MGVDDGAEDDGDAVGSAVESELPVVEQPATTTATVAIAPKNRPALLLVPMPPRYNEAATASAVTASYSTAVQRREV